MDKHRVVLFQYLQGVPGDIKYQCAVINIDIVAVERDAVAEELLQSMAALLGRLPGGLAISVVVVGALLALEGAHWIGRNEADIEAAVDRLVAAGFRMIAPTHRFNNALSASSEGCNQLAGLMPAGEAFLRHAESRGVILDLAHASDRSIDMAADIVGGPIVVSHTGLRATCPREAGCEIERNLRDMEVQAVARTGGVVGIGYWPEAVGSGMANIVAAFRSAERALSDPVFVARMRAHRLGTRKYRILMKTSILLN